MQKGRARVILDRERAGCDSARRESLNLYWGVHISRTLCSIACIVVAVSAAALIALVTDLKIVEGHLAAAANDIASFRDKARSVERLGLGLQTDDSFVCDILKYYTVTSEKYQLLEFLAGFTDDLTTTLATTAPPTPYDNDPAFTSALQAALDTAHAQLAALQPVLTQSANTQASATGEGFVDFAGIAVTFTQEARDEAISHAWAHRDTSYPILDQSMTTALTATETARDATVGSVDALRQAMNNLVDPSPPLTTGFDGLAAFANTPGPTGTLSTPSPVLTCANVNLPAIDAPATTTTAAPTTTTAV